MIQIQISYVNLHEGILDSNPDSDHLSIPTHVDCDLDLNLDSGPGACVVNRDLVDQCCMWCICNCT